MVSSQNSFFRNHLIFMCLNKTLYASPYSILTVPVSLQIVEEHCSVEQSRRAQAEPISLDSCLKAFTSEEELGEDELYYCSKCKTHRLATKKLDLWRLPPILVSGTLLTLSQTRTLDSQGQGSVV